MVIYQSPPVYDMGMMNTSHLERLCYPVRQKDRKPQCTPGCMVTPLPPLEIPTPSYGPPVTINLNLNSASSVVPTINHALATNTAASNITSSIITNNLPNPVAANAVISNINASTHQWHGLPECCQKASQAPGPTPAPLRMYGGECKSSRRIYFENVANLACLFWFADLNMIKSQIMSYKPRLRASHTFIRFVGHLITKTQLPSTAVVLALLYILRLRLLAAIPIVASAKSEYRVFTVALMLANKYLDDNTYTNKTWADISRLPLKEITWMEIEFLNGIGYKLHVTQQEWQQWVRGTLKMWLGYVQTGLRALAMPMPLSPPSTPRMKRGLEDIPERFNLDSH